MVVSLVHNQAMYNVSENALLKRCACSFEILEETIQNSMAGGERLISVPNYALINSYWNSLHGFQILILCSKNGLLFKTALLFLKT